MLENTKPTLYIDMDDTICHFRKGWDEYKEKHPDVEWPQSTPNFFLNLEPIKDAVLCVNFLTLFFDVYILTRPSFMNPLSYTEKRLWIEKHFGIEFCRRLILCPNKALMIGDYLVDDLIHPGFKGEHIHFGIDFKEWKNIVFYLLKQNEIY